MIFEAYLQNAWTIHAVETQKLADEFSEKMSLIESNEQIAQFGAIVTHVTGEHLGIWGDGISLLRLLKSHSLMQTGSETERVLLRSIASLQVAGQLPVNIDSFSTSDQVRILAMATCHLCLHDVKRSQKLILEALHKAKTLESKDPANRSLAISGNNLACSLEEKTTRSPEEVKLMILAAQTGRKYWELAGTWREVAVAEYRLAMTYLQAKDLESAAVHAQLNLDLCQKNNAGDFDLFFVFEALAAIEKQKGNVSAVQKNIENMKHYLSGLNESEKIIGEQAIKKLQDK